MDLPTPTLAALDDEIIRVRSFLARRDRLAARLKAVLAPQEYSERECELAAEVWLAYLETP